MIGATQKGYGPFSFMNHNAEVLLIVYPHGAGGRFLELLLTDSSVDINEFKTNLNRFRRVEWLDKLPQGEILTGLPWQDRYVFAVHDDTGVNEDFRLFPNLKVIAVVATTDRSIELLKRRRQYIGSPELGARESSLESTFQHSINPDVCIELEHFWTPKHAIPLLDQLMDQSNINTSNLPKLYKTWHSTVIQPIYEL